MKAVDLAFTAVERGTTCTSGARCLRRASHSAGNRRSRERVRLKKIGQTVDPARAHTDCGRTERGVRPGPSRCGAEGSVLGWPRGPAHTRAIMIASWKAYGLPAYRARSRTGRRQLAVMKTHRAAWCLVLAARDKR